jgi:hypothetical protein
MSSRRILPLVLVVLFLAGPAFAGAAPPGKGAARASAAFTWDAALAQLQAVLGRFLPAPSRPPIAPQCTGGMDPNGRCAMMRAPLRRSIAPECTSGMDPNGCMR